MAATGDGLPCSSSLRDVQKRRGLAALQRLRPFHATQSSKPVSLEGEVGPQGRAWHPGAPGKPKAKTAEGSPPAATIPRNALGTPISRLALPTHSGIAPIGRLAFPATARRRAREPHELRRRAVAWASRLGAPRACPCVTGPSRPCSGPRTTGGIPTYVGVGPACGRQAHGQALGAPKRDGHATKLRPFHATPTQCTPRQPLSLEGEVGPQGRAWHPGAPGKPKAKTGDGAPPAATIPRPCEAKKTCFRNSPQARRRPRQLAESCRRPEQGTSISPSFSRVNRGC
jgi:hypothetical protein